MNHSIDSDHLSLEQIFELIENPSKISLSEAAKFRIKKCRDWLNKKLAADDQAFYGINTGFGALCNIVIPDEKLTQLQENLLRSHACGTGNEVPPEIVSLMLLFKVKAFSFGHSGVSLELVNRIIHFFNEGICPVVYQQGSLGASGDLAPLAHLSLPFIGEGEIYQDGKKVSAENLELPRLSLQSKEGLALINGTQFMSAYGVHCLQRGKLLLEAAEMIACLSLEALDGRTEPFYEGIHRVRGQIGQEISAARMRQYLEGSAIYEREKEHVQDPYSLRCVPQVHGASRFALRHVEDVLLAEVNAVTDNPNLFPDEDMIVSGGNFHGQPLALALDYMTLALSELGSISERRTYLLLAGLRGLPPFLAGEPGLESGMMIPQYTAAALASENKQLCHPASADSISSSNGQEDHVSMGANAATKCYRLIDNLENILAIELLTARQAFSFREEWKTGAALGSMLEAYAQVLPPSKRDRYMQTEIAKTRKFIKEQIKQFLIK